MTFKNRKLARIVAIIMMATFAFLPTGTSSYAMSDEAAGETLEVLGETEATEATEVTEAEEVAEATEETVIGQEADGYIVVLEENTSEETVEEISEEVAEIDQPELASELVEGQVYYVDSLEMAEEIADSEDIQYIEPNYRRELCGTPNDKYYYKNSKYFGLVKANWAWNRDIKGQGLKGNKTPIVAVVDSGLAGSGVSPKHGKLKDINYKNVVAGTNFYKRGKYKSTFTDDDNGHGTFVTSEIAAIQNNGVGVTGLMPKVKICPIKITDNYGRAYAADIVRAIYFAVDNGADVINICMGSTDYSKAEEAACKYAENHGVIVVAASGNTGKAKYVYPAAYSSTISVGAVDKYGRVCSFSTHNKKVDVSAPGFSVFGAGIKGYGTMSGTSMAAPYVSALAAMTKSVDNSLTTKQFRKILVMTSTDKGSMGRDNYYGYGIMNFKVAYKYMTGQLIDVNGLKISLKASRYVYNGEGRRPAVSIRGLDKGQDYLVSYSNNVKVGKARVKIKGIDDYTGIAVRYFDIVPAGTYIKLMTPETGSLKVKWKEQRVQTSGYQLRYSVFSSMSGAKTLTILNNSATLGRIKNLTSGKKYYVQIRTYKTVDGTKYYSKWSAKRTAIVK